MDATVIETHPPPNQSRVAAWVREVFTNAEIEDVPERALRMAEEALELAQACEVDAATLHRLVDYVFSRPVGTPGSEIAGTMVTVYALAEALGVNAQIVFEGELLRIQHPEVIERCRRRQHEKRAVLAGLNPDFVRALAETRPITEILDTQIEGARRYTDDALSPPEKACFANNPGNVRGPTLKQLWDDALRYDEPPSPTSSPAQALLDNTAPPPFERAKKPPPTR